MSKAKANETTADSGEETVVRMTIEEITEETTPSPTISGKRAAAGFILIIVLLAAFAGVTAVYFLTPDTGLAGTVKVTALYALILAVGIGIVALAYKVFREKFSYFVTVALIGVCVSVVGCSIFVNGVMDLGGGTQTITTRAYEVKTKGLGERVPDFYIELQNNGDTTEITIDEDMYTMLSCGSGSIVLEYYPYVNVAESVRFLYAD